MMLLKRNELVGYGFTHIPSSPGLHSIEVRYHYKRCQDVMTCHQVVTWRPSGSLGDTISQHFLGGGHALKNTDLVTGGGERYRLTTRAAGTVRAQIHLVLRNFDRFGIEC